MGGGSVTGKNRGDDGGDESRDDETLVAADLGVMLRSMGRSFSIMVLLQGAAAASFPGFRQSSGFSFGLRGPRSCCTAEMEKRFQIF